VLSPVHTGQIVAKIGDYSLQCRQDIRHWPRAPPAFVPTFPVYVNFTLHTGMLIFCVYIYFVS